MCTFEGRVRQLVGVRVSAEGADCAEDKTCGFSKKIKIPSKNSKNNVSLRSPFGTSQKKLSVSVPRQPRLTCLPRQAR